MTATPPAPALGTAYLRPSSLDEACTILADAGPRAVAVAGCTSSTPASIAADPDVRLVVDLLALQELSTIAPGRIGATVTMRRAGGLTDAPLLAAAARGVGDEVIRAMATVGGNCAVRTGGLLEIPVALVASAGHLVLRSPDAERVVAADAFLDGGPALAPGEIVAALELPRPPARWRYGKLAGNAVGFPIACVAAAFPQGEAPRVVVGLRDGVPRRMPRLEEVLACEAPRQEPLAAARADVKDLGLSDDVFVSAGYVRHAIVALVRRDVLEDGARG